MYFWDQNLKKVWNLVRKHVRSSKKNRVFAQIQILALIFLQSNFSPFSNFMDRILKFEKINLRNIILVVSNLGPFSVSELLPVKKSRNIFHFGRLRTD